MPPCVDTPCMFQYPICLDATCMFGCPPVCLDVSKKVLCQTKGCPCSPYMFGCPPYITQHKESMLCHTKELSICPHTIGCPLHVWMPPACLDATICLDALHMFGCPTVCLDAAKCMVASKGMRDIQTHGGVQTYRGIQMYGRHMDTTQSDKACFLCVVYVQQTSNTFQTYMGSYKHGSVHTYSGSIQT